jgi:glycosyltransferase involved in cell wall biosynthesis
VLRVVQVVAVATPGPDGSRGVNGPELRALNSLAWTDPGEVRTTIVYPRAGRLWDGFAASGVDLVDLEIRGKFAFGSIRELSRILVSRGADLVHTQGSGAIDLFACAAARRCGVSFMMTRPVMIDDLPIPRSRRIAYQAVDRWTLASADAVVAVSRDGFDRLASLGVESSRLHLIYNGVDLRRFGASAPANRASFGIPQDALVVGACAQLTPTKAWDDFLAVLRRLRERSAPVHGLIVGDGPLRAQLEAQCRDSGLQGAVTFAGFQSDVSVGLRCMDVYLSMSKAEGLSVGLIEAMASALPAVVTDVGGTREQVLDGVNGFVVAAGDVDRAIAAVGRLASDVVLRRSMGEAGRRRAWQMFDVSSMVGRYLDLYRSVIKGRTQDYGERSGL